MAQYKVLQDIEAEDKLLGPLTLKQFIFAIIFLAIGFVEFKLATTSALSIIRWPIVMILLVPMGIFGFLAAPISREQSNDVWLLARIRFLVKPHARIWNQDGISELVTVTVPKKIERNFSNGLNQAEVQSRLSALASTLDSRGWAIKNVDVNLFAQPGYLSTNDGSDRLVAPSNLPASSFASDIGAADDMMDAHSNPTAQHLDQMMQASTVAHREQIVASVQQNPSSSTTTPPADYWFLNQPSTSTSPPTGMSTFTQSTVVTPGSDDIDIVPTADEEALLEKIADDKAHSAPTNGHMKTLQPLHSQKESRSKDNEGILPPAPQTDTNSSPITSGSTPNPAILNLANNNDLNVATIARQAQQISEADGEVTISLH